MPGSQRVSVCRCPTCGSTNAGPDESRSAYDFTFMQCGACGEGGLVDSWQRDFDWYTDVTLPDGADLPAFVAPLGPGEGLYDRRPATSDAGASARPSASATGHVRASAVEGLADARRGDTARPGGGQAPSVAGAGEGPRPAAPDGESASADSGPVHPGAGPFGCARCCGDDAAGAWQAMHARRGANLVQESHFGLHLTACTCGQPFVVVFTERVDWKGGEDQQDWLCLPVNAGEVATLTQTPADALPGVVKALGPGRRFLVRSFPTGGALSAWWRDGGFTIGPHD